MRVWLVIGLLAVLVGVTLVMRTRDGWEPTELERLEIVCTRGSAADCTLLGLRLLEGNPDPAQTQSGLRLLERGCRLGDANGCFLHGFNALSLGPRDASAIAAIAFAKGCALKHQDSCAYQGWLKRRGPKERRDLSGATTLLVGACGNGSALGCVWLGEIAMETPSSPGERASASRSFEKGCRLGNDWSCLRLAQALACGRGLDEDLERSLELLGELCGKGLAEACDQLVSLDDEGEFSLETEAFQRASLRTAFLSAQAGDRIEASRHAKKLTGEPGVLARAALATAFNDLSEAETLLAELPEDAGVPEVEVARQTVAAVKEGNAFPEAAWLGWARAGRPDLRKPNWIPAYQENEDLGACRPVPPQESLESPEAFLKAVASTHRRSLLDGPFSHDFTRAAMRFSTSPSLPVRLTALAVLKHVAASKTDDTTAQFEAAARGAFAAENDGTLFYALLKLPADLHGAATAAQLDAVERALTQPVAWPRRELFDAFAKALGPGRSQSEYAYSATVFVIVSLLPDDELSGWLDRGQHDLRRRARVLRALGEHLLKDEWLVNRYGGVRLLRASNALVTQASVTEQMASAEAHLARLRTGPSGYQAMGLWPWLQLSSQPEVHIEYEVREVERLQSLGAVRP